MSSGEEKNENPNVNGEENNGQGPQKNQTNKLALIGLGILCGVAAVVLIIFAVNAKSEQDEADELVMKAFDKVQDQFETSVFLEESDGKTISWKDDYKDLKSPESKKLIDNLKSKMIMSMADEGLSAEDIEVTSLASAPPRTKTKKRVDEAEFVKRNKKFLTSKDGGLKPPPLKTKEIKEEMKNVIATFKTLAKPSKNAAAFASGVSSSLPEVSKDIVNRMRSNGLKTSNFRMQAASKFLDVINKTIAIAHKNAPGIVTTVKPLPKVGQVIDCDFNPDESFRNGKKQLSVICETACLALKAESLIGGKDRIFHTKSSTCISAYMIGLIREEGGILELMDMGPGPLGVLDRKDPKVREEVYFKRIVITDEEYFKDDYEWEDRYLIKYAGPRIIATTPKSNKVPLLTEFSITSNPFVVTTTRETPKTPKPVPDPQMYMMLQYEVCCEGFKPEYNEEGSEVREKLEKRYVNEIQTAFKHVCNDDGASVKNVTFVEADKVEDKELETLATFRVNVESKEMTKCVIDLDGEVFEVLESKSRGTVGTLTSLQYGRGLEKEIESEKSAQEGKEKEGSRKKRSVGYLKRKVLRRLAKKTANDNVV